MAEYTPTTAQVRDTMALGAAFSAVALREGGAEWQDAATDVDWPYPGYRAEIKAMFDHWLAEVKAEAWDEAVSEVWPRGYDDQARAAMLARNPYRKETDHG